MKFVLKSILATVLLILPSLIQAGERSSKVKHIVILMMENRSFDHLLGWLKQDRNSQIDGLSGNRKTPRNISDHSYGYVPITRKSYDPSLDDPKHDFQSVALQIDQGLMDGFVDCSITH
jgi:phospholipase C